MPVCFRPFLSLTPASLSISPDAMLAPTRTSDAAVPKYEDVSFRANALNSRGIVGAGNLGPLVRTSWWS